MLRRIEELLDRCGSAAAILPPTALYNEGWMLRLVLDWFDRNRNVSHELSFLPEARWYSEALLPSRFLAQKLGDHRAESFTHADGIVGHFLIRPGERGEAVLLPRVRQFLVAEAKLGSKLSAGTRHAPDYDQAARNVACMARMLEIARLDATTIERLGFHVIAPETQIRAGIFGDLVTKESIQRKVAARVAQYQGAMDTWLSDTFEPVLNRIHLSILSWESILNILSDNEEASGIHEFYSRCLQFTPPSIGPWSGRQGARP